MRTAPISKKGCTVRAIAGTHVVFLAFTGSANFSEASTDTNDENMLVIRDEPRVADIYFTEFLRIYTHHAFRESLARHADDPDDWRPQYLKERAREWQEGYFTPGNERYLRRVYFAQ